jgi:hypothetical protein
MYPMIAKMQKPIAAPPHCQKAAMSLQQGRASLRAFIDHESGIVHSLNSFFIVLCGCGNSVKR